MTNTTEAMDPRTPWLACAHNPRNARCSAFAHCAHRRTIGVELAASVGMEVAGQALAQVFAGP
jgi:hypothetical protein